MKRFVRLSWTTWNWQELTTPLQFLIHYYSIHKGFFSTNLMVSPTISHKRVLPFKKEIFWNFFWNFFLEFFKNFFGIFFWNFFFIVRENVGEEICFQMYAICLFVWGGRCVNMYSLSFSPDGVLLSSSSNTETVHVFKLDSQSGEKYVKGSQFTVQTLI